MTTKYAFCVFLICASSLSFAQFGQRGWRLYGRVMDTTGCPIAGVKIEVSDKDGSPISQATTDASGRYEISELPGRHRAVRVAANVNGFEDVKKDLVAIGRSELWDVALTLSRLTDMPVRMINGTVSDESGRAIGSATVSFLTASDGRLNRQVRTDSRGNFSVETMDAGQYALIVSAPGYDPDAAAVSLNEPKELNAQVSFRLRSTNFCSPK